MRHQVKSMGETGWNTAEPQPNRLGSPLVSPWLKPGGGPVLPRPGFLVSPSGFNQVDGGFGSPQAKVVVLWFLRPVPGRNLGFNQVLVRIPARHQVKTLVRTG